MVSAEQTRARILDGRVTSDQIKLEVAAEVARWSAERAVKPRLAAVLVGDDDASAVYVRNKVRACAEVGIESDQRRLPASTTTEELLSLIRELNQSEDVDGILIQLPLPGQIDEATIIKAIDPEKDVDAFHPSNVGLLAMGRPRFVPCTPAGIIELLDRNQIGIAGKNACVVGRSQIVGRPVASLLLQRDATVTICHSHTKNLSEICLQGDLIVAALGKPEFVTADMVKEGAVIIDVGITRLPDSSKKSGFALKGDVHFASVSPKCSYITPVPGGVGPMTIAALMKNTFKACMDKN